MRALVILGVLSLLVIGGLVALVLLSGDDRPPTVVDGRSPAVTPEAERRPTPQFRPELIQYGLGDEAKREALLAAAGPEADEKQILEFGKEFHDKWYADRERLGKERHLQMEKLWFEGRRPRGEAKSIEKLEKLLQEFPDTNRAGCAAYELGQHYLKQTQLPLEKRRQEAERYWRLVDEQYRDSLCEFNQSAAAHARLALAAWIYRYTDPVLARRILEEIIQRHGNDTDRLGQPLSEVARRLLEQMP